MKHRSAAVALVAALATAPAVLTATATAAPAPATASDSSISATRLLIEDALDRSSERLARAAATRADRNAPAMAKESGDLEGAQRAEAATESGVEALATTTTDRIFGANRYETAVKISQDSHPNPAEDFGGVVFVANGMNFPDALAAGPAATSISGPVLLVPPTGGLPDAVAEEIERLDPDTIAILGKTDNVSAEAESELRALVSDPTGVFRVAGDNRYETSALLTDFVVKAVDVGGGVFDYVEPDTAIISTGTTFADALAGGAAGGWEYAPLLLTGTSGLSDAVTEVLTPIPADPGTGYTGRTFTTVRILGSTSSVSAAVEDEITALLPGATVTRYSGDDRFDTARLLNADVFDAPSYGMTMTNGLRFPDALAGAPRVNSTGGPTVIVRTECVPAPSGATLATFTPSFLTALGNIDAVSDAALAGTPCP